MRTAIVSTFPPRACGVGAFAADLRGTLLGVPGVTGADLVAVVSEPSSPQRRGVLATIAQSVRGDYVRTARMLGRLDVDVVLLQHEYGIFGGRDGEYVLSFAEELAQPLVVTLHTVLSHPTPDQAEVLTELCAQAELVIVMTDTALRLLVASGACPEEKVRVVPHGAPTRLTRRAADDADPRAGTPYRRAGGRFLISTFGLISPGKGLETVIEALPSMIARHPEIRYVIAGRTHPDVAHREGERYRLMLERRVVELDLGGNVEFDDRFLAIDELSDLLAATDVFVTPYRSREEIASGALTFALAAGCGIVSTPYWYAQDVLASGAGRLVPFDDPAALAAAVCAYKEEPETLVSARLEARRIGASLAWPSVAEATATVLQEASALAPRRRPSGVASSRPSWLRSRSPERQSTAFGRRMRSSGSSDATASSDRSTTSQPEAAATDSAKRRATRTKAPSRHARFTAPHSCSTRPASAPPSANVRSNRLRHERPELFRRHPADSSCRPCRRLS